MKQFKVNKTLFTVIIASTYLVSLGLVHIGIGLELLDVIMITALLGLSLITIYTEFIIGLIVAFLVTLIYGVIVIVSGTTSLMEPVTASYIYLGLPTLITLFSGIITFKNQDLQRESEDFDIQYKELVRIDDLTGFRNVNDYRENLQEEIDRKRRYDTSLSLMLIHIESFDELNELYGKQQGDQFLKYLSEFVVDFTRNVDKHYRISSDVFAIVLPNTNEEGAKILRERFIDELEALSIVVESSSQEIEIEIEIVFEEYSDDQMDAISYHALVYDHLQIGGDHE